MTDGTETVALPSFAISVSNTNDAPTITGTPSTSVDEDSSYSFTPTGNDVDTGDTLTFAITGQPSWASFDTATGALTGTPTNDDVGNYSNIIISVTDGTETVALPSFAISVSNTNDAPTITGTPSTSVDEDSSYSFTPTGNDVDSGDTLSYSISGQPSWASFDTATGALTGTPTNDDVGNYSNIIISVTDGTETVALPSFAISVSNTNDAPTITGTPSTSVDEDSSYSFTPTGNDVDTGDTLSYSISGQPSWASFDTATGALTGTPTNDDVGNYSNIIISITDGTETVALPSFAISVSNTNDAPIATNDNFDIFMSIASSLNILANDSDVDVNDTFSITDVEITSTPSSGSLSIAGSNLIYTPNENFYGNDNFSYRIADQGEFSNVASVALTIIDNINPEVIGITLPTSGTYGVGETITFTVNFNEPVVVNTSGGTPRLVITVGDKTYYINYQSGSGSTSLEFSYTVQSGDTFDGATLSALLDLNGGVISDPSSNDSATALAGITSLENINFDTLAPVLSEITAVQTPATNTTPEVSLSTTEAGLLSFSDSCSTSSELEVDSGTFSLTLTNNQGSEFTDGEYSDCQITITDAKANESEPLTLSSFIIDTTAPVLVSNQALQLDEGQQLIELTQTELAASDIYSSAAELWFELTAITNHGELKLAQQTLTNGSRFSQEDILNGLVSYSHNGEENTQDSFSFNIIDHLENTNDNQQQAFTFTVNIEPVNDLPTMLADPQSLSATEDVTSVLNYSAVTIIDAEDDQLTLTAAVSKGNLTAQNNDNIQISGSNTSAITLIGLASELQDYINNGQLSYTTESNDDSNSQISLYVEDSEGTSSVLTSEILVSSVNDSPVITGVAPYSVNQDQWYQFLPMTTDIDNTPEQLSFTVSNKPQWLNFNSATGELSGTPSNADVGGYQNIIIEVSDGAATAALASFGVEVVNVNDRPEISGVPPLQVNQGSTYYFAPSAIDIDLGTTLTFSISNLPEWAYFDSSNGALRGTPDNNNVGSYNDIVISVSDGSLQASLDSFTIEVININDAPIANNDSYDITFANGPEFILDVLANDYDKDPQDSISLISVSANIGTVSIVDNQIIYTAESSSTSDTLNYSIVDDQGLSASAQVSLNISLPASSTGPTLIIPADIEMNATGIFTEVDLGIAEAFDSNDQPLAVTVDLERHRLRSGIHKVFWSTQDELGNSVTKAQTVIIHPQVSLKASNTVIEGSKAQLIVNLSGEAPYYPLQIPITIGGTADNNDHDLRADSIIIEAGRRAIFNYEVFNDTQIDENETIIISLDEGLNLGRRSQVTININDANVAPELSLIATQGQLPAVEYILGSDSIEITSVVTDVNATDSHEFVWFSNNFINNSTDPEKFKFTPADIAEGIYEFTLTVTDSGEPALSTSNTIYLNLVSSQTLLDNADSDNDGIPDSIEGRVDSDGDGIVDYLDSIDDCHQIHQEISNDEAFFLETGINSCIRRGNYSYNAASGSVLLSANNPSLSEDDEFTNNGGVYDFIVYELNNSTAEVVIPLKSNIPNSAVYRKYSQAKGWDLFVVDSDNQIYSTKGIEGFCPSVTSELWSVGLTEGHWCIKLLIEDGGPNDEDGIVNGVVKDPGGIAVPLSDNTLPIAMADSAQVTRTRSISIDVLVNDSDADNDGVYITEASTEFGEVTIVNNQLLYVSDDSFVGNATIYYSIADGNGGVAHSQVNLTIIANNFPVALSDQVNGTDRDSLVVNVLANDYDEDNHSLTLTQATVDIGAVSIIDNQIHYQPVNGFEGTATITYKVEDELGGFDFGTLTVEITAYKSVEITNTGSSSGGSMMWFVVILGGILSMRSKKAIKLCTVMVLGSATLQAQANPFIELQFNNNKADYSASSIKLPTEAKLNINDSDSGYRIALGYQYNERISASLSYIDMGKASTTITADTLSPEQYQEFKLKSPALINGFGLGASYQLWSTKNLSFNLQPEVIFWKAKLTSVELGKAITENQSGTAIAFGVDAAYQLTSHWQIQLGFKHYPIEINDIDSAFLGFKYRF
ncbi:Ig-like domain-containing protein [Paraferrimonas sp. SM1919]|uniref:Ig-like domain-containing protein n=1 Tax=Paraferrimonas sp. SM1919 TaxID=2662263 RepID=UPI001969FDC9|nr:Ig-like domain-containing protein [Paraferrimonas sp. SM1919]